MLGDILKLLTALQIFSAFGAEPTEYFDNFVHPPACSADLDSLKTLSSTTPRVTCTAAAPKLDLGTAVDIVIHSIVFDSEQISLTVDILCQRVQNSNKLVIEIKKNVKQIVFSVKNVPYVIVVATVADKCPSDIDVPLATLESGYVEVKTVKCIEKKYLTKYEKNMRKDPKPFVAIGEKLCFFNPSLTTPIHVDEKVDGKDYRFTISAYPKPECPQCTCPNAPEDPKPKLTS